MPGSRAGLWLDHVAGIKVEHHHPDYVAGERVTADGHARAVLHTTEGSFESAHDVFRQHYAPTFLVGYDRVGKLRIKQYAGIGIMVYALENTGAAPETNRLVEAQVEMAAKSSHSGDPLLAPTFGPMTDEFRTVVAALMLAICDRVGVPLRHAGDGTRSTPRFLRNSGWYGHSEVPDQPHGHWDPGNFGWHRTFALARPGKPKVQITAVSGGKVIAHTSPIRPGKHRVRRRLGKFLHRIHGQVLSALRHGRRVKIVKKKAD